MGLGLPGSRKVFGSISARGTAYAQLLCCLLLSDCADLRHGVAPETSKMVNISNLVDYLPSEDQVVVSRQKFEAKLRGRPYTVNSWQGFKSALGPDAAVAQEETAEARFMSGLSIAFVIILNVLVWAIILFSVQAVTEWARDDERAPRFAVWTIFIILCIYALAVYAYCQHAYQDPSKRLITNFLYGVVPLSISIASYMLALLVLDMIRLGQGSKTHLFSRINPWEEHFDGRLIFFLAVLPGLALSVYLGRTVSTGFKSGSTHIDVLSLCLFIDVGRFVGHFSYLAAPEWSIGKSRDSISSRPGLCYIFFWTCVGWYVSLARLEAGQSGVVLSDPTKIRTLASLTSYVFFPLSLYLSYKNLEEFFDSFETLHPVAWTSSGLFLLFIHAAFMMIIGILFDALEPNLMGIATMLFVVIYGAGKLSDWNLFLFILAMIPLSAITFGAIILASHHAAEMRDTLLSLFAW